MTADVAQFDRTRDVLIALADAERAGPDELFNAHVPFDPTVVEAAIHILDDAGVIEACCHADWNGKRVWKVRRLTSAGRDVARLVRDERIWTRLKHDLPRSKDPFSALAVSFADNFVLAG